jgi:hypothetical protein
VEVPLRRNFPLPQGVHCIDISFEFDLIRSKHLTITFSSVPSHIITCEAVTWMSPPGVA